MNERDFLELIREAIELINEDDVDYGKEARIKTCNTFDQVGMLTMNEGLVVQTAEGDEFQITIVQSRSAD